MSVWMQCLAEIYHEGYMMCSKGFSRDRLNLKKAAPVPGAAYV